MSWDSALSTACSQRAEQMLVPLHLAQQHANLRQFRLGEDPARRLQPVHARNADVHEHHVWTDLARQRDRFVAASCLCRHSDVTLALEHPVQARPTQRLTICEQCADRRYVAGAAGLVLPALIVHGEGPLTAGVHAIIPVAPREPAGAPATRT